MTTSGDSESFRLAQKLDALAQFHSGLAHDINNRLTTILGNLDLMQFTGKLDLELVTDMQKAANEISNLIRLEQTYCKRDRHPDHPVAIATVLHELQDLLDRSLGNEIGLNWEVPASDCFVNGDESIFEQIIVNLFLEARVRVADSENPSLLTRFSSTNDRCCIEILSESLSPCPVPWPSPEVCSDPSELPRGLGLSITRQLVEELNANLVLESDENTLRIALSLPLVPNPFG